MAANILVCLGALLLKGSVAAPSSPLAGRVILAAQKPQQLSTNLLLAGARDLQVSRALRLRGGGGPQNKQPAKPASLPLTWQQHLVVGGIARGTAVATLFPIDSIKTKMQVGQKISLALTDIGQLFQGFRLALLGQIPYGMLVFGSYETAKSKIFARHPEWQNSLATKVPVYIGCAALGDTIGALWLTPSEMIKQRLQSGQGTNAVPLIKSMYANSGLAGFYSGLPGMLARDIPYRAMQLPMYEVVRDAYTEHFCTDREIMPHEAMLLGACVGMVAAGLTTPLDVVKSRMMVGTAVGKGVSTVLRDIYAEAGVKGLFKGAEQRIGYLGLNNAIFFNVYEFARGLDFTKFPACTHSILGVKH